MIRERGRTEVKGREIVLLLFYTLFPLFVVIPPFFHFSSLLFYLINTICELATQRKREERHRAKREESSELNKKGLSRVSRVPATS